MEQKIYRFFNRPFSPHLTIYQIQKTSLLSILHRFTGILLLILIINFIFLNDLLIYLHLIPLHVYKIFEYVIFAYIFTTFNLIYHAINGTRFILNNFGFGTSFTILQFFFANLIISYIIKIYIILCF